MQTIAWMRSILLSLLGMTCARSETIWRDAASFGVEGRGWTETTTPYHRFPARAKAVVPSGVWELSKSSAGLVIRFLTRAERVEVRWSLTSGSLAMPHMPATGVSGVDLYAREGLSGTWRFVQNGRPGAQESNQAGFRLGPAGTDRECLLYLPLYNGVSKLELGTEPGAELRPATESPSARRRPIVIYGTSIVQGGCASRPGMAYPAIVGRRLDRPVINLGFSGSGRMEPGVVDLLAEQEPGVFVIDCLWNLSGEPPVEIERRVTHLIDTLRQKHPTTPIVFVAQSEFRLEQHPTLASQAQERAVRARSMAGVAGLHVVAGTDLLGADREGTVDGVHPNDLGMLRHAEVLTPVLARLLGQP